MKSEINVIKRLYDQTLWLVCDYTELNVDDIYNSNREECVDARYILVGILTDYLTDEEIAKLSGLTRACCNKIRNGMATKLKRLSFRCLYSSVKDNIKEWYATNLQ